MSLKPTLYYFLVLTSIFILFTPIGTLSHEYGHIIAAKILGYKSILHYGSMDIIGKEKSEFDSLMITLGGPLLTILTGTIGIIGLFLTRQRRINKDNLSIFDWGLVFISLFWLRQVFIVIVSVISEIVKPDGSIFGGDEGEISKVMGLPNGTVSLVLGTVGVLVFVYVLFKIISKKLRIVFLTSAFVGGALGFILWMRIIGPILLP